MNDQPVQLTIQQEIIIYALLVGPRAMQVLAAIKEAQRREELKKAFGKDQQS